MQSLIGTGVALVTPFKKDFSLFIITVAAAESSIGLAILVMYYRRKGIIAINVMNYIKG